MKLVLEPGDLPGGVETLRDDADAYGWWCRIVCRPGGEAFAVLAYRGGGVTLGAGEVEVVFAEPEPEKKPTKTRTRRPKAAA